MVIGIPPYGDLPSSNDERGHPHLGKKNAAKQMRNLGSKVSLAPRGLHGWAQAFRLRRGKTRRAFRCYVWPTKSGKLVGRFALERRRPGSGREPKPPIRRDGGVSGLCPATGRATSGRPGNVTARQCSKKSGRRNFSRCGFTFCLSNAHDIGVPRPPFSIYRNYEVATSRPMTRIYVGQRLIFSLEICNRHLKRGVPA